MLDEDMRPDWSARDVTDRQGVTCLTDAAGRFEFAAPPTDVAGGSVVVASHPGHATGGLDLDRGRESTPVEVVLQLADPVEVTVLESGKPQAGAIVRQAALPPGLGQSPPHAYVRFLHQEAVSDQQGHVRLPPFACEQEFWAEKAGLVSAPWQGAQPSRLVLELGGSFTIGGVVTFSSLGDWDLDRQGGPRILVSASTGNVWRPLVRVGGMKGASWGPVIVPLGRFRRFSVRLEGEPIVPVEEAFEPPRPGSYRRFNFLGERKAELVLTVRDEEGHPIPGARAVAWWGNSPHPGPLRTEATADPDGRIRLASVPTGWVEYAVSAPGYALSEAGVPVPSSWTVTLARGGSISGRCLREGSPVDDFEVVYWQQGSVTRYRHAYFFDRQDGTYRLESLPAGEWTLYAASSVFPSGRATTVRVASTGETRLDLELPTPIRGGGRIVDAETGDGIASARVQPYSSGGLERSFPWGPSIAVEVDGSFDLDAFVLGSNYLTVVAEGYARGEAKVIATSDEFLDWGDIRLFRPQPLQVSLLAIDGLQAGDITLNGEYDPFIPGTSFDDDGQARFETAPPGDHRLFVNYADGAFTRLHLRLDPGEEWEFELKVLGDQVVDVSVLDAMGEPPSEELWVAVAAEEECGLVMRCKTLRSGRASFTGIRAPRAQVLVGGADNTTLASREVSFEDGTPVAVELRLDERPFRARVVDGDGAAVVGAFVTIRSEDGAEILAVDDTDSSGWAVLSGVDQDAVCMDVKHGVLGGRFGVPIDASAGEVEFVLDARGEVELSLLDGDVALEGVSLRLETTGGLTLGDARQTDDLGRVRFGPLGEGRYRFACSRKGCWPTSVEVELGADEQARPVVQMRRLADAVLELRAPDGAALAGVVIDVRSMEFEVSLAQWLQTDAISAPHGLRTDVEGRFQVSGLPRGRYRWSILLGERASAGDFELSPGANTLRIQLP